MAGMDSALDLDDLTEQLCEGCTRASALAMPYIHVALAIPFRCRFEWFDADGTAQTVFLPTRAWVRPVEYQPVDLDDHAAQAKFLLHVEGGVPDREFCAELASELYRRSVVWAQTIYGQDMAVPHRAAPLPDAFASLVRTALD